MTVRVNGEAKDIADGLTVAGLIEQLGLGRTRVAVEVNKELAVKKKWAETVLREGDKIEIVTFVGGG